MSWVSDYKYTWLETMAMSVIQAGGNLPYHLAFVMDGNRRYANTLQIPNIDGHSKGFDKLADCLRWCLDIGIREVTTFAFSIENFKRSDEEVKGLLDLAREKFLKLLEESSKLHKHGVCIRVIGNLNLLPKDLQRLIAKAMLETVKNDRLFLNIAFSYTSRDEITQAVETIIKDLVFLEENDISESLIENCLYARRSSPNLLFRTSGETRISDFLMWQLNSTILYFAKKFWPQITVWDFLASIFFYQRSALRLESFQIHERLERKRVAKSYNFYSTRVQKFLRRVDILRKNMLLQLCAEG